MRPGIRSRRSLAVSFVLACAFLAATAAPARADITAFIGLSPTPDNHSVKGFSVGVGLLIVGFEFEYANLSEDDVRAAAWPEDLRRQRAGADAHARRSAVRHGRRPGLPGEPRRTSRRRTSGPTSAAAPRSRWSDRFACGWTIGSSGCRARRFTTLSALLRRREPDVLTPPGFFSAGFGNGATDMFASSFRLSFDGGIANASWYFVSSSGASSFTSSSMQQRRAGNRSPVTAGSIRWT